MASSQSEIEYLARVKASEIGMVSTIFTVQKRVGLRKWMQIEVSKGSINGISGTEPRVGRLRMKTADHMATLAVVTT